MPAAPRPRLRPPVTVMAAAAAASWPVGEGWLAEPKWDGWIAIAFRTPDGVYLQSRHGRDLSRYFPDVVAAAMRLPVGTVLDGELVAWAGHRTDFALLQRRVSRPGADPPVYLVCFYLLEHPGGVLVDEPLSVRRAALEQLLTAYPHPQLVICPQATPAAAVDEWALWDQAGIEGVVFKPAAGSYRPGSRDWRKVRTMHPVDLVVGGVTGSLNRPGTLLLGEAVGHQFYFRGRTAPLAARDKEQLGELLPLLAGGGRPWPNPMPGRWVNLTAEQPLPYHGVEPVLVVEVDADTAVDHGRYRHMLRLRRVRLDLLF
ncbi:ATP-dependent DNA ligase [Catellatospora sp. NPDC049133]|uniref:ATP-dependent DNA ligase n=1 Tax=Catellatospora sp. NPDC049133 TaxID=3155499 RepID=UPI0034034409